MAQSVLLGRGGRGPLPTAQSSPPVPTTGLGLSLVTASHPQGPAWSTVVHRSPGWPSAMSATESPRSQVEAPSEQEERRPHTGFCGSWSTGRACGGQETGIRAQARLEGDRKSCGLSLPPFDPPSLSPVHDMRTGSRVASKTTALGLSCAVCWGCCWGGGGTGGAGTIR